MALKWSIAFLSCILVLGSALGETERPCDEGPEACEGSSTFSSDGQGNTLCCPSGFSLNSHVSSSDGVTTRTCTCTQGSATFTLRPWQTLKPFPNPFTNWPTMRPFPNLFTNWQPYKNRYPYQNRNRFVRH